ncbi:MAG: hypothetical protein LUG93_09195 [Lachnospiraceae bacterium]|nr:hypothetical protein [Lachnospiraceae bacterium]
MLKDIYVKNFKCLVKYFYPKLQPDEQEFFAECYFQCVKPAEAAREAPEDIQKVILEDAARILRKYR